MAKQKNGKHRIRSFYCERVLTRLGEHLTCIFNMKLLDKYLLHSLFVPLGYCLLTFSMIFVVVDLFEHLSDFIDAHTPFLQILRYYLFLLPSLLVFIAPISLLLGILYALWHLGKSNEIMAMRVSGISLYRLMVPWIMVGLCLSMLITVLQQTIAPWSNYWSWQFILVQKHGDESLGRYAENLSFKNENYDRIWHIQKFDFETFDMDNVEVIQQRPDGSDFEKIRAEKARYFDGSWWLYNVSIQRYDFYNNLVGGVLSEPNLEMMAWNETPRDFINEAKELIFLSSLELRRLLRTHVNLSKKRYARIAVDMYSGLAMPWTSVIVVLFGIPCGLYTARKGAFMGVLTAIMTFFSFYFLMNLCQWLGKEQFLDPLISGWMPNMVFLLIGLLLLARAR